MAEARIGHDVGGVWEVGGLARYFTRLDDEDGGPLFGAGVYAKLRVDPNASVPLANWLPQLGDWMGLPETIKGETYIIAKGQALPYDWEKVDFGLSIGPGVKVGPVTVEYVYEIIESGSASNPGGEPVLFSGATLWFGLAPLEF
jgi:hypothetical protein